MNNDLSMEKEASNVLAYPWRRFLARMMDVALYGLMIKSILLLVLRVNTIGDPLYNIIEGVFICVLMFAIEPLMLYKIGTTPGKWILGLLIRNSHGEKLTYGASISRTWQLIQYGMGFNLPFYNVYRIYKCGQDCSDEKILIWDEDIQYILKDEKPYRWLGYTLGCGLLILLLLLMISQTRLPINRGDISAEEYYENCNDYIQINKINYGRSLGKNGQWVLDPYNERNIHALFHSLMKHKVVESNGKIQKVSLTLRSDDKDFISNLSSQFIMAYTAFIGSDKSINSMSLYPRSDLDQLAKCFENFEFQRSGYKISNHVVLEGYEKSGDVIWKIRESDENLAVLTFTIERID